MSDRSRHWILAGIGLLCLGLHSLGFQRVFVDGQVILAFGDPYYHLRLALYSLQAFPDFLTWDPYLAFPTGAGVPWPPLYDLLVAATARSFGGSPEVLEWVAAWWPPVLAALTLWPVYIVGRAAGGPALGLGAAALFAVVPAGMPWSRVGYADHHAAVTFLGASLLATHVELHRTSGSARLVALLIAVRAALVLTWSGSLTYLAVAELTSVLSAVAMRKKRLLALESVSLVGSGLVVLPFAAAMATGLHNPFSALYLSWLQPLACGALAIWAVGARELVRRRPEAQVAPRLAMTVLGGATLAVGLLSISGVAEGVWAGLGYVANEGVWQSWVSRSPEWAPLFAGSLWNNWGVALLGLFSFALPLVPLAALLVARTRSGGARAALVAVAAWSLWFGVLSVREARFVNDLAPSLAVGLALLMGGVIKIGRSYGIGSRVAWLLAAVLVALCVWPAVARNYLPEIRYLARGGPWRAESIATVEGTLVRFARQVREATPETSGFQDPADSPEYGILASPSLGHVLHAVARRPTAADNFGPVTGSEGFERALRLLSAPRTGAVARVLDGLGLRYVVTTWQPRWREGSLAQRLHEDDGRSREGEEALQHFRLVAEGPDEGIPYGAVYARVPSDAVPYKLFEVVRGAQLEIEAPVGASVTASVTVLGSRGRSFTHVVRARSDESGKARFRIPYATGASSPVATRGPYRVQVEGVTHSVEVSERAVRNGTTIRIPRRPPEDSG